MEYLKSQNAFKFLQPNSEFIEGVFALGGNNKVKVTNIDMIDETHIDRILIVNHQQSKTSYAFVMDDAHVVNHSNGEIDLDLTRNLQMGLAQTSPNYLKNLIEY